MSGLRRIAPWVVAATMFAATVAHAQVSPLGLGDSNQPLEVFADHGIEWHQNENAYVARGNARAVRGDSTLYAQTLTAYYRKAAAGATGAGASAQGEGGVQIYRVDAAGAVRIVGPGGTAYGDHAVYDVDKGILVMTGSGLKLVTERETITARDSLEYWQQDDQAVARGNAVAVSDQNRIQADILTAQFVKASPTARRSRRPGHRHATAPNRRRAPTATSTGCMRTAMSS